MKRILAVASLLVCLLVFSTSAAPLYVVDALVDEETCGADTGPNSDEMAEGYIRNILYGPKQHFRGILKSQKLIGLRLTGIERYLYDNLKASAALIASGEQTCTRFEFPVEEIYPQISFTADDLGVSVLVENGAFTAEAKGAMNSIIRSFSSSSVLYALLSDCPYELYWFNKTNGWRTTYPGYSSDGETVTIKGTLKITMGVAEEYALDEITVNPKYGQGVQQAVQNATQIVTEMQNSSTYDKLLGYKNAICSRTSYNYEALEKDTAYGNPWQLIWVFDDDENTNVVCEGYAKAFKYLCDLSDMEASVICVTGRMQTTSTNGRHMWNIVDLDEEHYLVDVTNCDSGTIGYPDALFMAGAASGNVNDGYFYQTARSGITYTYDQTLQYTQEELTMAGWSYLNRPVPSYRLSSTICYPGYAIAVIGENCRQMDVQYNRSQVATSTDLATATDLYECVETGDGSPVIIPIERDTDIRVALNGDAYGAPVTVRLNRVPENAFTVLAPEIGEEAFAGIGAEMVTIRSNRCVVGARAFAGCTELRFIMFEGISAEVHPTAFDSDVLIGIPSSMLQIAVHNGWSFVIRQ